MNTHTILYIYCPVCLTQVVENPLASWDCKKTLLYDVTIVTRNKELMNELKQKIIPATFYFILYLKVKCNSMNRIKLYKVGSAQSDSQRAHRTCSAADVSAVVLAGRQ